MVRLQRVAYGQQLRHAFGAFPSGVAAVCARVDRAPIGLGADQTERHRQCQLSLFCANQESSSQRRQRRTLGMPSPIHEMISRWISLLPPPKVKMTAER